MQSAIFRFALCTLHFALFLQYSVAQVPVVDQARATSAGVQKLEGRHLTLFTDLPSNTEVDRLPEIFDRAVPQMARYFELPAAKVAEWHMQGYLIKDRTKFDALDLMPAGNDGFVNGFSLGSELWLYDQPTDYYRRHLLLHEGVHGFMANQLGSCGPGWYMEGTAELLATHKLDESTGKVTLQYMPLSKQEVPMLGRIKLVRDAFSTDRALPITSVLKIDNRRHLENESYAWCWALARMLDDHPRYRERFRLLKEYVLDREFNAQFRNLYDDVWSDLALEWQLFVASLDHGHDVARTAIDFRIGKPVNQSANATVAVDRGWQSTELKLEAGRKYRIWAKGRYQIAKDEAGPWPCEPNGVTIKYHAGRPLGMLLGAIDPGRDAPIETRAASFLSPIAIGLKAEFTPEADGTLYLKVNDSPGKLGDNAGKLTVTIR